MASQNGRDTAPSIRRILWPTDFSEPSRHALDQALAIAGAYGASLTGLHVGTDLDQLMNWLARCDGAGVAHDALIDSGAPAPVILRYAKLLPADMIVLGTHGTRGFEHLVIGSVTEHVLRRATCPVVTVPPRAHTTSRIPCAHVLCGIDFNDWSLAAVALASSLASKVNASLTLVHVIEWPWREPPPPTFADLPAQQAQALSEYRRYVETSARSRLDAMAADIAPGAVVQVRHGKPYVEILTAAAELASDLIVLGVHGRNLAELTLFGSTTNQVVRQAACPVLTLRR